MVQVTIPFPQNAMSQNSLIGGMSFSLTLRRKLQMVLCGEQILTTSAFVVRTIFQMLQTLSSLSLILMIRRMFIFCSFLLQSYLINFRRDNGKTINFEYLIRSLLTRSDQPAVIILGHFSPQVFQTWGLTGPDHWHSVIANHYDVPHLSTKPLLYDDYVEDYETVRKKYYADPILANSGGHTLLSDVLIAYFQSMTCQLWNVITGEEYDTLTQSFKEKSGSGGLFGGIGLRKGVPEPNAGGGAAGKADNDDSSSDSADTDRTKPKSPTSDPQLKVPQSFVSLPRSSSHRSNGDFDELSPHCVSANDLINPLPPSLFYGSGWKIYHPSTSHISSRHDGVEGGATAAHYFYSTLSLSRMRIPILVAHGDVGIYYLKEDFSANLRGGSEVECWVDDNYNGRRRLRNDSEGRGVQVT